MYTKDITLISVFVEDYYYIALEWIIELVCNTIQQCKTVRKASVNGQLCTNCILTTY